MGERGLYDLNYRMDGGELVMDRLVHGPGGEKRVERVDAPIDPYCYIRAEDYSHREAKRLGVRAGGGAPEGFVRIEADHPRDIRDYNDETVHQTFEADVDFSTRVMIDEDWGVAQPDPEDILYFDIEVDDRGDFAEPEDAPDRIISIAAVGGDGEEYYFDGEHERGLIKDFVRAADSYTILAGWNSLGYDYEYLDERALKLGVGVDWTRWARLDLMPLYDMLARPTETLDTNLSDTAERELEEGLHDDAVDPGGGDLYEAWREEPDELRRYNMRDAEVLKEIDEKYDGIIDLLFVICDICGVPPEETCYQGRHGEVKYAPGQSVDAHILSVAHERGVPMPNKGRYDTHNFPGADVLDPEGGFYEKVATLDYSGMYPNIVRAFNFGPTTWYETVEELEAEEGEGTEYIEGQSGYFVHQSERRSIMAEAVDELVEMREGAAEVVDKGVKVINNTLYGVCAAPFHRYYKPGMSENITLIGQRLVRLAEEGADRCGDVRRVIYGDTDSVMVELDVGSDDPRDLVDAAGRAVEAVEEVLREWAADRGADGEYLQLDIDDVYRKFFIGDRKKRYFGHRLWKGYWSNDVKVTGLEAVQGDVPAPCREMQRELIDAKLFDGDTLEIVQGYKERLHGGELDEHMATRKGLGKPVDEYEGPTPPVHARAAEAIRERFGQEEISVGSKVGYIKYGRPTEDWTWAHDGEIGRELRPRHYSYLWEEKFVTVMDSVDVSEHAHEQSGLGDFVAAGAGDD